MFGKKAEKENDLEFFTIYDSKSGSYERPVFAKNQHVLVRDIMNMFKDPAQAQNKFLVNAEDFSIFKIGCYDFGTGLVSAQQLEHVANMHDLRTAAKQQEGVS